MRILGSIGLIVALSACANAPVRTTAASALEATERPLPVWSVEGPSGRVSHVLGTLPLGVPLDEVLPPPYSRALDEARVLVVPFDWNADPEMGAPSMFIGPDDSLSSMLGEDLWARLLARLHPTSEGYLQHFSAAVVARMLTMREAYAPESEHGEPALSPEERAMPSIDIAVMDYAQAHGMAVVALESADEPLGAPPSELFLQYLRSALTSGPPERPTRREQTVTYLSGSQAELEQIAFDPVEIARSPELFEWTVYRRTEAWLDTLDAELVRGGAFVVVGLEHVMGERGLLRLLERRGYRATRLVAR